MILDRRTLWLLLFPIYLIDQQDLLSHRRLVDCYLPTHISATDESLAPCLISHQFSSPATTSLQKRLCLLNWSISCLRRPPLLHTSHLANIYMCHFNCVPISSPKLFTYSLTHTAKLPFSHVTDLTGMAVCCLNHNFVFYLTGYWFWSPSSLQNWSTWSRKLFSVVIHPTTFPCQLLFVIQAYIIYLSYHCLIYSYTYIFIFQNEAGIENRVILES